MTLGVRAVARAKLTLSLTVLGRRPDGYHDVEALVVSLAEPYDVVSVRLRPFPGVTLSVSGRAAAAVPAGGVNLAVRAAELILEDADDPDAPGPWAGSGLYIVLHKVIPAGAGLGGGSADAAATLLAAANLLDLRLDGAALAKLGSRIGSDVPFCAIGGTAWMRGRGEIIDPLPPLGPLSLVVAVPPFTLSTPAVYEAWDRLGGPRAERACPAPPAVAGLLADLVNDLEPAAESLEPRLRPFRDALERIAGGPAVLAGSGSAYAVTAPSDPEAAALAHAITLELGAVAFATRPVGRGVDLGTRGP